MILLRNRPRVKGFTLIELAISLAITGFALISLLGMFPVGLANFKMARQQTFYAEMIQTLQGEVETTSFSTLAAGTSLTYYFDGEGNPLTSSTGAVYEAVAIINSNSNSNYTNGLNTQIQGSPSNVLYLTFELINIKSTPPKVLRQCPYIVGNSGN